MKLLPLGIAQRTALLSWCVTLATLLIFVGGILPWQKQTFLNNLESKARSVTVSLREVTAGAAVNEDYSSVIEHCKEMLSGDDTIAYLVITKNDGFTLVNERSGWRLLDKVTREWHPAKRTPVSSIRYVDMLGQRAFHYSTPFDYSGLEWGWIHVGLSLDSYDRSVVSLYRLTLSLGFICVVLSLIASFVYARKLVRPILDLRSTVQRVAEGNLTVRAKENRGDELGGLAKSVNDMTSALIRHDQILGSVQFSAQLFLSTSDWRATLPDILSRIGQAVGVCRAYVIELTLKPGNPPVVARQHEWRRPGLPVSPSTHGELIWPNFSTCGSAWIDRFKRGEIIAASLSNLSSAERQIIAGSPVRSLLIIPIMVEGNWCGLLGLDDYVQERQWRHAERDSLQTAADMLGSAITRQHAQDALLEAKATLEHRVHERTEALLKENTERKEAEAALARSLTTINATLESTLDGILVMDNHGRVKHYNQRFAQMWGFSQELLSSGNNRAMLAYAATHVVDPKAFIKKAFRLHADPLAEHLDIVEFTDGRIFERYTRPQQSDGVSAGRVWCYRDITERKRTEAKISYERDLLQTLMDGLPDTLYFKDLDSRFVRISRSKVEADFAALHARLSPEEQLNPPDHLRSIESFTPWMIGKTDFDIHSPEIAQIELAEEQEIIRTGTPLTGKIESVRKATGATKWYLLTKMPWRDQQGRIIGLYGMTKDITVLKEAEEKLASVHDQLMHASRQAGMAEVATGVLHNVGNVLNSVNVSATVIRETLRTSELATLARVADLMRAQSPHLAAFLTSDPRGKHIPEFIIELSSQLANEHAVIEAEHAQLARNVEHIKKIVTMQQSHARVSGVHEKVRVCDLLDDALQIKMASLARDHIEIIRDYAGILTTVIDKHKVLQILVNLIQNARYAVEESGRPDRRITLRVAPIGTERFMISVTDNGIGIPPENLTRIFSHGFTTRRHGHGFGLHSGANAAREMGGSLRASSPGLHQGATFTLELPLSPERKST